MSDSTEYIFRGSEIKTHIFLNLRQPWCQYRKNISKNGFSKKISAYRPDIHPIKSSIDSLEHVAGFTNTNIQKRLP